jgi:hypothetical protein
MLLYAVGKTPRMEWTDASLIILLFYNTLSKSELNVEK